MLQRLNISKIITDHLQTLNDLNRQKKGISSADLWLFFLAPSIISITLVFFQPDLRKEVSNLITATSIFGGFLFNLQAIIYGLMDKLKKDSEDKQNLETHVSKIDLRTIFVKEIHVNISFCIILSIFLVVLLSVYSFLSQSSIKDSLFDKVILFLILTIAQTFLLTLLMIVNRVYIIMSKNRK